MNESIRHWRLERLMQAEAHSLEYQQLMEKFVMDGHPLAFCEKCRPEFNYRRGEYEHNTLESGAVVAELGLYQGGRFTVRGSGGVLRTYHYNQPVWNLHINAHGGRYRRMPLEQRIPQLLADLVVVAEKIKITESCLPEKQYWAPAPIVGVSHLARLLAVNAVRAHIQKQVAWPIDGAPESLKQVYIHSSQWLARMFGDEHPVSPQDVQAIFIEPADFYVVVAAAHDRWQQHYDHHQAVIRDQPMR